MITKCVCRIVKPGPVMTSPSSPWSDMGGQPYQLGTAPDAGEGCGNHQMGYVVLSGLETQPEPGAPSGRNGRRPLTGHVTGSREVEPALEFSEVRNWDESELEVSAGLRRRLLTCQWQYFRTGSPPTSGWSRGQLQNGLQPYAK